MQMCYNPAAPPLYVMAVLSETRVVRVQYMVMATLCCAVACACVGVASECARLRLTAHGDVSTKLFLFLIMPKRRDCAKSVSASYNDLHKR